jgi:hypothetical protein
MKVIDNEICFKYTEYDNIRELFHSRETMHRRIYTHRSVLGWVELQTLVTEAGTYICVVCRSGILAVAGVSMLLVCVVHTGRPSQWSSWWWMHSCW